MVDIFEIELKLLRSQLATNPSNPHIMDTHVINTQRDLIFERSKIEKQINKYLGSPQISKERSEKELDALFEGLEILVGTKITVEERKDIISGKLEKLKETLVEKELQGTTIFFRKNGKACIGDHMIYGFLKASAEAISRCTPAKRGTIFGSASYTTSCIHNYVRCKEEFIFFDKKPDADFLQRSLRAITAQGPRISIAKSEIMPAGAKLKFNLTLWKGAPLKVEHLKKMFEYGQYMSGLGQWRNSGHGMFTVEMFKKIS